MYSKVNIFFVFFFLFVFSISCNKDEFDTVPYVPVYYEIDIINQLNLGVTESVTITAYDEFSSIIEYPNSSRPPSYIPFATRGNGIIIYQGMDGYYAFDLTCTYRAREDYCAVEYDASTGIKYQCPCCNSVFNLTLGANPEGNSKAVRALKAYPVSEYGNELIVANR